VGANLRLQGHEVAAEELANCACQRRFLLSPVVAQDEYDGLPADIVGTSRIAQNRPQTTRASDVIPGIPPDDRGAGAGNNGDARVFLGCGQRHAEIAAEKYIRVRESGPQHPS
jgi:hypothetical protein